MNDHDLPERSVVAATGVQWQQLLRELEFSRTENTLWFVECPLADVELDTVDGVIDRIRENDLHERGGELVVDEDELRALWHAHSDFKFDFAKPMREETSRGSLSAEERRLLRHHRTAANPLVDACEA